MNERIRALYKEATGKDWAYDFDPQVAEKFAQLIVQQCIAIVDEYGDSDEGNHIAYQIEQHFGVE